MKTTLKHIRWFEQLPFRATELFNKWNAEMSTWECFQSTSQRYQDFQEKKERKLLIQSTNNQGKVTRYRDGVKL